MCLISVSISVTLSWQPKSAWWDCYITGIGKYPKLELCPPPKEWLLNIYWHFWIQLINSKVCSECNNSDLRDIFFSTITCHAGATNLHLLLLLPSSMADLAMAEIVVFIMVVTSDTLTSHLFLSWCIYSCDVSGWDFQHRMSFPHFCPIFSFEIVLVISLFLIKWNI